MQPSEFWLLSSTEFWWEYDTHQILSDKIEGSRPAAGGFDGSAWAKARKIHKEKMKQNELS